MTAVWLVLGTFLIAAAGREIFHQLFHPAGKGTLTELALRSTFATLRGLARRLGGRGMSLAGPLGVVLVLGIWATMLVVGFALVYLPFLPNSFQFATGVSESGRDGLGAALYVSLVTLATLGYGDITPTAGWLRFVCPTEALLGFALLSAGVTWMLSLYPALVRLRSLANEVHVLSESGVLTAAGLQRLGAIPTAAMLAQLAGRVVTARVDFQNFSAVHISILPIQMPRSLMQLYCWSILPERRSTRRCPRRYSRTARCSRIRYASSPRLLGRGSRSSRTSHPTSKRRAAASVTPGLRRRCRTGSQC